MATKAKLVKSVSRPARNYETPVEPVLKAIGITCGVGSMLVGARAAGFEIAGNVEWRKYYSQPDEMGRRTFDQNFPGSVFRTRVADLTPQEIERFMGADIALGHPECGNFSRLSGANKNSKEKLFDPADIPLFVDLVAHFKPRFFVMDDLPKSFMAYPMEKYAEKLPEYDLFPEWISNWGYGNVQKYRDRMFMLGALKTEKWAFRPGEREHAGTVASVIGDLPKPRARGNYPNHDPMDLTLDCFRALNLGKYRQKNTWAQVKEYFRDKPGGYTLDYFPSPEATAKRISEGLDPMVKRIGFVKGHWDGPAHVLTGGNASLNAQRCEPYTIRERARIQGFPDDFVFYGTVLNPKGEWNHDLNQHMVRQTGKAMPIQFCTYVAEQMAAHMKGEAFESSGQRVIGNNDHVSEAKEWYCTNVGYADQPRACGECWLATRCAIRVEKYGMPPLGKVRSSKPAGPSEARAPRHKAPRVAREPKPKKVYAPIETKTMTFKGSAR